MIMWIAIIIICSIIMWKVASVVYKYNSHRFIPMEEVFERSVCTDTYVPWSYDKRMKYYRKWNSQYVPFIEPRRVYRRAIETGYTDDYRRWC